MIRIADLFKIGVGPSSSHTLGPWKACLDAISNVALEGVQSIKVELFGSLALTGIGHATNKAIILGLSNWNPVSCLIDAIEPYISTVYQTNQLQVGTVFIPFNPLSDIIFNKKVFKPFHQNALSIIIYFKDNSIKNETYYSIGGGFIVKENEEHEQKSFDTVFPYPCNNASQLLEKCTENSISISELVIRNETTDCTYAELEIAVLEIWNVMKKSAYDGCHTSGILPGGLNVIRRASTINAQLIRSTNYHDEDSWIEAIKIGNDFSKIITRVSCIAMAVNEVNASMGRVVTSPTNGSAGVIPAVLFYYICFSGRQVSNNDIVSFFAVASEIGKYFKLNATISAAAGGCQAEIGVSSSMAAAALTERLGGTVSQCLMAAEIAAEHHLGLTCDPMAGLVQVPCIERNSMGAIKAITASMIALSSDPLKAKVSLDQVIETMFQTAKDMNDKYKETSLGGLANLVSVNKTEC